GAIVQNPATGAWIIGDSGTVWDSHTGGTQYLSLLDDNQAPLGSVITAESPGYAQQFYIDSDPPVEAVWIDFGGDTRVYVECNDRATHRVAASTRGQAGGVAALDGSGLLDTGYYGSKMVGTFDPSNVPPLPLYPTKEEVPSLEDIFTTVMLLDKGDSLTARHEFAVFPAPMPLQVLSVDLTFNGAVAESDTDYWTFTLSKTIEGNTNLTIATKTTQPYPDGEGIPGDWGWPIDSGAYDPTNSVLGRRDCLTLVVDPTGSPNALKGRCVASVRYARADQ
ncbi:MAG: hypothetical protein ACRDQA_02450, partial [Nocardioidaceae bacterium]